LTAAKPSRGMVNDAILRFMGSDLFLFELLREHEPKAAVNRRTLPRPRDFARFEAAHHTARAFGLRRFSAAFHVEVHGELSKPTGYCAFMGRTVRGLRPVCEISKFEMKPTA